VIGGCLRQALVAAVAVTVAVTVTVAVSRTPGCSVATRHDPQGRAAPEVRKRRGSLILYPLDARLRHWPRSQHEYSPDDTPLVVCSVEHLEWLSGRRLGSLLLPR
jgi:hypothetical protein